ncbi:HeH/LEM domain-containing protein, partial [Streptococcus suis]
EANGVVSGGNWVLASEFEEAIENLTVPQLKEKLDELGIEYNKKAQKAELLELLEAAKSEEE